MSMIEGATIEGFRGLRQLEVDGFGRVNLVIGKNNCGKTALLEALMIAADPDGASHRALALQAFRRSRAVGKEPVQDFDRFWRPLFWSLDAERGFSVVVREAGRAPCRVRFHKSASPPTILTGELSGAAVAPATWAMDVEITNDGQRAEQIVGSAAGLKLPPLSVNRHPYWISPLDQMGSEEIGFFSKLKQAGREEELLDILRTVDHRISGIEILAPAGIEAELFVRLDRGSPLLPLSAMGDGLKRCFQIGVSATVDVSPVLFIDEIENGLHHATHEPVWRWLATISKKRALQVFATTHSEECLHAAARVFTALDDDGLRVIRLDRREDRTTAAVYDRDLVETAVGAGVEIRG
jgi:hypothetical protein